MKSGILPVLNKVKYLFIPYLIVLAACLIISVVYSKSQIYFTFNSWHFAAGDAFFPLWTNMGDGLICVLLTLILLLFNYRKGFLMGSSYIITSLIAQVIKRIVATPRPVIYFKAEAGKMYLVKGVAMLETLSFPSGHSVSAFSAAVVLTYITPKKGWGLLFLLLAILVGYSRMYLSEHFFEDVVGGSVLGVMITIFWIGWIDNKPFIRSKKWDQGLLKRNTVK
jgi:membrane-associated phospholipid phosphatase